MATGAASWGQQKSKLLQSANMGSKSSGNRSGKPRAPGAGRPPTSRKLKAGDVVSMNTVIHDEQGNLIGFTAHQNYRVSVAPHNQLRLTNLNDPTETIILTRYSD